MKTAQRQVIWRYLCIMGQSSNCQTRLQHMSIRKGVGLLSAEVFVVGTEVGLERSMDGSNRGIVTQAGQKGRSNELTTGLDNNNRPLYCLSLRIVGLECQRVMR